MEIEKLGLIDNIFREAEIEDMDSKVFKILLENPEKICPKTESLFRLVSHLVAYYYNQNKIEHGETILGYEDLETKVYAI